MTTTTTAGATPGRGLLPDPEPRAVRYTVISVDDHLVEPPWLFEGRLPARLAPRAPRVVETAGGAQQWEFDGKVFPQLGFNALVGRVDKDDFTFEPARFDDMRRGCFDIHERIRDMDINGIWASVCFPSQITGFCGRIYSACRDPELGLAVTRAFNDWIAEEWHGTYPERIVPMGITYLADPEAGAAEVRRNAERGFTAVSLPEQPQSAGMPSIHSGWWDPVIAACEETGTVVCLHIGSSGSLMPRDPAGPPGLGAALFQAQSYVSCSEWLWSGIPARFPGVKLAMSEGGIGWVPMLMDRLEFMMSQSGHGRNDWKRMNTDLSPTEVLQRNFWFCTIDDPSTLPARERIGVDHIMLEVDYPHADSTWPDSQRYFAERLGSMPVADARKIAHQNAAALFRHPLPAVCAP
jgi:predicted TIM-barrel fold metal-dependent hydrolase